MASIQDTNYPRLKSNISHQELEKIYTPKPEEFEWVVRHAKGSVARLGLLVSLKIFHRLGYFVSVNEVPPAIIQHISDHSGFGLSPNDLQTYNESGTRRRHQSLIRDYFKVRAYGSEARQVMIDSLMEAAKTKDEPADLINVAVEKLVKHQFELPVFNTLNEAAKRVRVRTYRELYERVYQALDTDDKKIIDNLFQADPHSSFTPWNQVKQEPGPATPKGLRELVTHREWLASKQTGQAALKEIPLTKRKQLAAEAKSLDAGRMIEMEPKKRVTLAAILIADRYTQVMDDIGEMLVKRMMSVHSKGKKDLKKYQDQERKRTDELVETLRDMVAAYQTEGTPEERIAALKKVIGTREEEVLKTCDAHLAYAGNNYHPFLDPHFRKHRATFFRILRSIRLKSTSQDKLMESAIDFLLKHQNAKADWIPVVHIEEKGKWKKDWEVTPLLDLSWVPDTWWRWISPQRKRHPMPEKVNRRHFEVCVFSQVVWELKSGDLYIEGSEKYADYNRQLISLEEYEEQLEEFCEQTGLPPDGSQYVDQIRKRLETTAAEADRSFPHNEAVRIENGEPVIAKLKKKSVPDGLERLEDYLLENIQPINVLDMLTDTEYWLNWTRFFGPLSGHDAKLENPVERYLTTVFCYGCNLGPTQTARSLRTMDRRQIAWVNQRHISEEMLDKAIRHIINSYNKFILPKYWGTGKSASADGTKWDLYERNLLAEHHIRYGGYGGIGYYHVSDTYIALFSRFIPCGVWEGVYILDILLNDSDIQPDTLHADTQGQTVTVFGLASLLGIDLMPRIRNWKDLILFRPSKDAVYEHIDCLFTQTIDWGLIETHYPDMLRVVMSIKAGRIHPSTILNKLGTYSRKNRLYQAFQELGRVVRTIFLLRYLADKELRQTIQEATNKSEAFNGFTKWLSFGGEGVIGENDREKQRKVIKYNHLVANCLIFYNVFAMTHAIQQYTQEGHPFDKEVLGRLSPYLRSHVNRFGQYRLDPNRRPPAIQFDMWVNQEEASAS